MCVKFVILFAIVVIRIHMGKASTGCFSSSLTAICNNSSVPDIPYLSSRDPTIMISEETSKSKYCDLYAITKRIWYKSESTMSTTCPSMYMCGTKFPIWMNGSNPEPHEGIVNRTACVKDFESCCLIKYRLAAVNCGNHMAYCLIDPPSGCHQRYCFDVNSTITTKGVFTFSSSTTTVTSLTHTTTPVSRSPESTSPVSQRVAATTSSPVPDFTETSTIPQGRETSSSDASHTTKINGQDMGGDKELIVILMACLGLMAAIIIGLVIFIVHRRRNLEVDSKSTKSPVRVTEKKLVSLSVPGLVVLSTDKSKCLVGDRTMYYENLQGKDGVMYESLKGTDGAMYESLKRKDEVMYESHGVMYESLEGKDEIMYEGLKGEDGATYERLNDDIKDGQGKTGYDTLNPYQRDYNTIPEDQREGKNNGDVADDEDRYQILP